MTINLTNVPGSDLAFDRLAPFLGERVVVKVADHPNGIQNGPTRWAGTVEAVFQRSPEGRHASHGLGEIRFVGGGVALWGRSDFVTITRV